MSLKNTYRADKTRPTPLLNRTRQQIGKRSIKKLKCKEMLSAKTNTKKTHKVRPKFIKEETFFDSRNKYFGILIFVKILALLTREFILPVVDSLKYENIRFPQNK